MNATASADLRDAVSLARTARAGVLVGRVPADAPGDLGWARPGVVMAEGPDAASFLHSQITNDVEGVAIGAGNLQARVLRTGHLQHVFSLHHPVEHGYALITEGDRAQALHDDLDAFLFADDVRLSVLPPQHALVVQGPHSAALLDAVFGPLGFEPWDTLPEHAVRVLRRAKGGLAVPAGSDAPWLVRRSLSGSTGFVILVPTAEALDAFAAALEAAAPDHAGLVVDAARFAAALEVLRVEAGLPRVAVETAGKKRLLPETGLEQQAVSYTKGCYLGQEVIARVRTYGSVPQLLRALVLHDHAGEAPSPEALAALDALPPPGTVVRRDGKKVGMLASRTWSPEVGAPVVLAYLHRDHRAPGEVLELEPDGDPALGGGAPFRATVHLLPLHHAPDSAARVQHLYDRAIKTFAAGGPDHASRALAFLEEALRLDPGFADAYEVVGVILGKSGRFHEAIDVFRRLEEVAPDEPLVNTNLSLYFMKLGDKDTAEDEAGKATLKQMAKARGASAGDVDADLQRSKRRDAERKQGMFRRVLDIDADDPVALFGLGTALSTLGQHDEAVEHLAHASAVDANNSAVYEAHGKALEALDRLDEALAVYRRGIEVASRRGDLMPLKAMQHRVLLLGGS